MARSTKENEAQESQPAQPYDTTFKDWIRQSAREVLPLFLPGAVYEETLNVELIKPTMRADKVFKVIIEGKEHIVDIEFESGADSKMASRLLVYNTVLHHDYQLPVISIIVYPFRTTLAKSPLQISGSQGEIITFHFQVLPLFLEDAERYVREHIVCMYPLIPTMQGTDHRMMKQVIAELTELYREDEVTLAQQIVWMNLLLERTDTIAPQEKATIQKELSMYDQLWEESPKVQRMRVESEIQGLQRAIVKVVKARFPALEELAQEQITHVNSLDKLDVFVQQVSTVPDENTARWLLKSIAA